MIVARTIEEVREAVGQARRAGRGVSLVPTMGYLHEGHLSLVDLASEGGSFVVVSIFVNPKQFGPSEDLATYPRSEARDLEALRARGVDLVFAPVEVDEIYPAGFSTTVRVSGVSEPLEGERRPGHFEGVATVVLKLFNIVQPDRAVFGRKDAQQCAVVKRMVTDLDLPVQIVLGETRREEDGLAMSSRNSYLSATERSRATLLHQALKEGRRSIDRGASIAEAERLMSDFLEHHDDIRVDYLRVVDPETFDRPFDPAGALVVGALWLGRTRLIDNIPIEPIPEPSEDKLT